MKRKRVLAIALIVFMFVVSLPFISTPSVAYAASATTPAKVTRDEAMTRLQTLVSALKGSFFTTTGKTCHTPAERSHPQDDHSACHISHVVESSWFKKTVDLVPDMSVVSISHYAPGGSRLTNGWSCCGFANFAGWYVYAQKSTDQVTFSLFYDDGKDTAKVMAKCRPGDIIRTSEGHSMVFIQNLADGDHYQVIDCNWCTFGSSEGNCKIQVRSIEYNSNTVAISRAKNLQDEVKLVSYLNYSGKNYLYDSDFTTLNSSNWSSRDTNVSTVSIDSINTHNGYNSLKIVNNTAGASGKDLSIKTMTRGRILANFIGDNKNMILSFYAKASNSNTKMFFRWGHESEDDYRSVTLSTSWAKYSVRMDKEPTFSNMIYPYINKGGTVWISEVQLEDGTSATAFVPENGGAYQTVSTKFGNNYKLPSTPTREGYKFAGWFTKANGGTEITSSTETKNGHITIYAHWTPDTSDYNLITYLNYSGKNYLMNSDFTSLNSTYWDSRDTDVSTVSIDSNNKHNGYNSLKIVNSSAGESGKDLKFRTMTQSKTKDDFVGDNKSMILSFWAKSSVSGTKMFFRWGQESTDAYRSVSLTTSWAYYTVRMDKNDSLSDVIYPYIDKAGTVWISEVQLEDGTSATDFVPETGGLYQIVASQYGGNYTLPSEPVRTGYVFDGWYTAAASGSRITSSSAVKSGHFTVYAHWTKASHTHTPKGAVVENEVAATCESAGSYDEVVYCAECGAEMSRVTKKVPAKGHTEVTMAGTAATCTETGLTEGKKCSVCGEILQEQETIPATGHVYGDWMVTKEATCTEAGTREKVCVTCGTTVIEEIDATGHDWGDWYVIQEATEEKEGIEGRTCNNNSSHIETRVIPKPDHQHNLTKTAAEEATCTKEGNSEYWTCTGCGRFFSDKDGTEEIEKDTWIIPKQSHTEVIIEGKKATCTESGLTEGKKCSVCGETLVEQEVIPKAGHTEEILPGKSATCTETGLTEGTQCSVCGEILLAQKVIPAKGHEWSSWITLKEATEEEPGLKERICENDSSHRETKVIPILQVLFDDVQDPGAWYYETVYTIAKTKNANGKPLMSGYGNSNNFGPADPLTRQDFAVILYRLADEPKVPSIDNPFLDTDPSGYYYQSVLWAKAFNVIAGYNDGRFGVGDKITREQVATILYRFAKDYMDIDTSAALKAGNLSKFNDGAEVSSWAKEGLTWATGAGVITGKSNGTLVDARGNAARAEIGAMIQRFMNYMDKYQGENQ